MLSTDIFDTRSNQYPRVTRTRLLAIYKSTSISWEGWTTSSTTHEPRAPRAGFFDWFMGLQLTFNDEDLKTLLLFGGRARLGSREVVDRKRRTVDPRPCEGEWKMGLGSSSLLIASCLLAAVDPSFCRDARFQFAWWQWRHGGPTSRQTRPRLTHRFPGTSALVIEAVWMSLYDGAECEDGFCATDYAHGLAPANAKETRLEGAGNFLNTTAACMVTSHGNEGPLLRLTPTVPPGSRAEGVGVEGLGGLDAGRRPL